MGSGGSQKVKNEVKLPWYQEATGRTLYERGSAEAAKPYTPYTGQRVAGFAPEQQQAFANTVANQGSWMPLFSNAQTATQAGGQSWIDPGVIDSYIGPFQHAVTDIAARDLTRDYGAQEKLRRGRSAQTASWGGAREGVSDAASQRDFIQQLSDLYSTGAEKAYQSGLGAFQGDRAAKQQTGGAFASLAQMFPQLQMQDSAALEAVGGARQEQQQRELDSAQQQFIEGRDWNKDQLSWLASLMQQTPAPTSTTQSGGGASTSGQVLGGIQSLGSLGALAAMAFSDRRLKTGVRRIGRDNTGLNVYRYRYIGGDAEFIGYMADEVREVAPHAVVRIGGYDAVIYGAI